MYEMLDGREKNMTVITFNAKPNASAKIAGNHLSHLTLNSIKDLTTFSPALTFANSRVKSPM